MRIIGGKFRGKKIPFSNNKYGMADITTDKVKEALFSIIQMGITGSSFLDLFGCSGQIGYEAYSRGASKVYINEVDVKRFLFIKNFIPELDAGDSVKILNKGYSECLQTLNLQNEKFEYIYIDPPYNKLDETSIIYQRILSEIIDTEIIKTGTELIIQHFSKNRMDFSIESIKKRKTYKYGNTSLTFFLTK